MEKFEEMLEQYLDNDEISKKLNLDDVKEEENVNYKKKTCNNFFNTVTISDFVKYYLGTDHDCKDLKHKGLKSFNNPYVVGISNEFAVKNPDCIRRNEILVVIDSYGNPGTYINPLLLKQLEDMETCKTVLNLLSSIRLHNLSQIVHLYDKYMKTVNKIEKLEQQYIDGCDLLNQLQKNSILKEIKEYVKEISLKGSELVNIQNEILLNLIDEGMIIEENIKFKKGREK